MASPQLRTAPGSPDAISTRSFALSEAFDAQLASVVRGQEGHLTDEASGVLSGYLATLRKHLAAHKAICAAAQKAQHRAESELSNAGAREQAANKELAKLRDENRKLKWKSGAGSVTSQLLRGAMAGQKKTIEQLATEAMAESERLKIERDEAFKARNELEKELKLVQSSLERLRQSRSADASELSVLRETHKTLHRQVDSTANAGLREALSEHEKATKNMKQDKDEAVASMREMERAMARKDKALKEATEQAASLEESLKQEDALRQQLQQQKDALQRQLQRQQYSEESVAPGDPPVEGAPTATELQPSIGG